MHMSHTHERTTHGLAHMHKISRVGFIFFFAVEISCGAARSENGTKGTNPEQTILLKHLKLRVLCSFAVKHPAAFHVHAHVHVKLRSDLVGFVSAVRLLMNAGLARVLVNDVIECPSTNFDLVGIRVGCELLRNLCVPAHTTGPRLVKPRDQRQLCVCGCV